MKQQSEKNRAGPLAWLLLLVLGAPACNVPFISPPATEVVELPTDVPTATVTSAPVPTPIPTDTPAPTPNPGADIPSLVWLPYASGAYNGDLLVVRDGAPAREAVPAAIQLELFWDYSGLSGRLAYAARFWHAAEGSNKSVSDLWVYDYASDTVEQWLPDNVARAAWSPLPDPQTGESRLAVVLFDADAGRFDLALVAGPGQVVTVAEYASIEFAWSPDGEALAFARTQNFGLPPDGAEGLYVVDAEGGEPRKVSDFAYQNGGWIGDQPVWALERQALIYADGPLGVAPLDGSGDITPTTPSGAAFDGPRPFAMLWSSSRRQLIGQTDTMLAGSQVWVYEFSEDLRTVVNSHVIGAEDDPTLALVGWVVPGEIVLLASDGGYGEPLMWSLAENRLLEPEG